MSFQSTFSAKVEHIAGMTTTVLDDVQGVTITQGRNNLSDPYRSATMVIEGRNPASLPNIKIGDTIKITIEAFDDGVPVALSAYMSEHEGRIADFSIDYGTIPALDRWVINTEDAIAVLGRASVSLTVPAGTVTSDAAKLITDAAGVTMTIAASSVPSVSTVKATTFDNANALDAFQTYANTENAFVVQQGLELLWIPRFGWTNTSSLAQFSDDPIDVGSYDFPYQQIQFSSLADTVAEEVIIAIRGGNTVTTGVGDTYVEFQTYDSSDTQAFNLAQFIKVLFTNDEPQPYKLSYMLTGQNPATCLEPVVTELRQVTVKLRGSTSYALVCGFTISITPEVARATVNLLSKQNLPFFVLDDPVFGILDTNVLSY